MLILQVVFSRSCRKILVSQISARIPGDGASWIYPNMSGAWGFFHPVRNVGEQEVSLKTAYSLFIWCKAIFWNLKNGRLQRSSGYTCQPICGQGQKAWQAHLAGEHPSLSLLILADADLNRWFCCKISLGSYILYFVEVCSVQNMDRWREGCVAKLLQNLKDHAKSQEKYRANHLCGKQGQKKDKSSFELRRMLRGEMSLWWSSLLLWWRLYIHKGKKH